MRSRSGQNSATHAKSENYGLESQWVARLVGRSVVYLIKRGRRFDLGRNKDSCQN